MLLRLSSHGRAKEIEMTSRTVLRSVASFVGQLRKKVSGHSSPAWHKPLHKPRRSPAAVGVF